MNRVAGFLDKIRSKKRLYYFISLILMLTTTLVFNIFLGKQKLFFYGIMPLLMFVLTILFSYKGKVNWKSTSILSIILMLVWTLLIYDKMAAKRVAFNILASFSANVTLYIIKKIKKENHETVKKKENNKILNALSFLYPVAFIIAFEIFYKIVTFFKFPTFYFEWKSIFILFVIMYLIFFLALSLFKNTYKANIAFTVIFSSLYIINQIRIFYTNDVLQLTDALFLTNMGETIGFATENFKAAFQYVIYPLIVITPIILLLISFVKKYNVTINNKKINITLFLITATSLTIMFSPIERLDKAILKRIYNYGKEDTLITTSNTEFYNKYTVIAGMYGRFIEKERITPDDYNEEELKNILKSTERITPTWKKPNVIVIFSESFWDLSKLKDFTFDKDPQSNFHTLSNTGKHFDMISPSYGGISANVEFEVLTGANLSYFSNGYIPYQQLFQYHKSENNPSVIREFKNNGYKTVLLNSSSKRLYSCDKVYKIYGIDSVRHLYDEHKKYVSDEHLTNEIIKYFNSKPKDEKTFYFTITMGGHMPYNIDKWDKYDIDVKSNYGKDLNNTVKSYAEGMYKADKELGRLYNYIQTLDEETIIVFFGDHLPLLKTQNGDEVYTKTGYLSDKNDTETLRKKYNTEALILSNYNIKQEDFNYISPDLLLTYVMNNMDLELSDYYKWLYQTINTLPSYNLFIFQEESGNIDYTNNLKGKEKGIFELRKKMQYMLFK